MADTRAKPLALLQGHRTKAEIEARAAGEKALTTSMKMEHPKGAAKEALAHWTRIRGLMADTGLDEAFYERVIWRYCLLLVEHDALAGERQSRADDLKRLRACEGEMKAGEYFKTLEALTNALDATDRQIAKKRDQLLAIEKENLMTVQGKLRAVPKKPEQKKLSAMEAFVKARKE